MKKEYEKWTLTILRFDLEDIVTASPGSWNSENGEFVGSDGDKDWDAWEG